MSRRLREIEPLPEEDADGGWIARVRVVTEFPDEGRWERLLEDPSDRTFDSREEARRHATKLALRYLADRLEETEE